MFLSFVVTAAQANTAHGQLVRYLDDLDVAEEPTSVAPTVTASDFVLSSTGLEGFTTWGGRRNVYIRTNGTADSEAAAVEAGNFFSFTVTPKAGEQLNLGSLNFELGISGAPPNAVAFVRSSLDSFETTIGSSDILAPATSTLSQEWASTLIDTSISLEDSMFQAVESEVTFRIYLYDELDTSGDMLRLTNIQLNGDPAVEIDENGPETDLAYGRVYLPDAATDTESRSVRFRNNSDGDVVIDAIGLVNAAAGVFSITDAPETPFALTTAGDFDVTVELGGAESGGKTLDGHLLIEASRSDGRVEELQMELSGAVFTAGESLPLNANPSLDANLAGWTSAGEQVSPGFGKSPQKVRVRGRGEKDARDSFGQNSIPSGASDFVVEFLFALPDFQSDVGSAPSGTFRDRSLQFIMHSDTNIPTSSDGVWDDANAASAMVNLAYLPAGNGADGEGFYVFNGDSWQYLPGLGTVEKSTDADEDGALDPASGDLLNVYQLSVAGSGFGTQDAAYDVSISAADSTDVAATAEDLVASHATSIESHKPAAYTFTTGDRSTSSGMNGDDPSFSSSFWIDEVTYASAGDVLPFAVLSVVEEPDEIRTFPGDRRRTTLAIRNDGLGADLDVGAVDFADSRYSLVSPSGPIGIAPGATETLMIELDPTGTTEETLIASEMTITSNNVVTPTNKRSLEGLVFAPGNSIFGSFEIPGSDPENGTDTFAAWYESQQSPEGSMAVPGLIDGSQTAAYLDETGWMRGFVLEPSADFELETNFAIKPSSGRQFSMVLRTKAGGNTVNIRYEGGTLAAFSGGWQTLFDVDLAESIDTDGNGSLDDSGDTKVTYHLKITARWNDANAAEYDVEVRDSNGALLGTAENQRHFQTGILGEPLESVTFTTRHGNNEGFWVDDVVVTDLASGPDGSEAGVTLVGFAPAEQEVTLRWDDLGGNAEIIASDDLSFGDADDQVIEVNSDNGTLDTATYPGKVQFIFRDSGATGSRRFWQVRQDLQ